MDDQDDGHTWVSLREAARSLGITEGAARRRVKLGKLTARLVPGSRGPAYQVCLPSENGRAHAEPIPEQQAGDPAMVEMVRLVSRLQEENRTLAGQLGYIQSQVEQLRETIRALEAPKMIPEPSLKKPGHSEPATARSEHVSWWRRWFGG
jgi:hypothetical protein